MHVDLHSHTDASDGALSPADLCGLAVSRGVELLAITDHDTVAGYRAARDCLRAGAGDSADMPLRLVPAVEYSSIWSSLGVHVVGLGIDVEHTATLAACSYYGEARRRRAGMIGERLAKLGMPGAAEGALALAGSAQVGRPHFARYLVRQGHVRSEEEAFDRYLGAGRPGDIKLLWPELGAVVDSIRAAGGIAVLAHPLKYRLTATRLRRLVADFAACGGGAMEVVVGRQTQQDTLFLARLAEQHGLQASVGSDFHGPGTAWSQLGDIAELPGNCEPVWLRWQDAAAGSAARQANR